MCGDRMSVASRQETEFMSFTKIGIGFALFCMLNVLAAQGQTQSNTELGQARQEMEQLKQEYEQMKRGYEERFARLDERLKQMESAKSQSAPVSMTRGSVTKSTSAMSPHASTSAADQNSSPGDGQSGDAQKPFRERTDSIQLSLDGEENKPIRERMETVLRNYVDITGYFRAGYGRDDEGGQQVGFQAPGALAKGRLGNEPENYGELIFSKNFYLPGAFSLSGNAAGGASTAATGSFQVRLSMYNPYTNYGDSSSTQFGLAEAWAAVGNVSGNQPSLKVWAGNRYYRRHDVHIDDFFLYNMSGGGGGVEDIKTAMGKLAFAWIGLGSQSGFSDIPQPNPQNKAGFNKSNFDFRLYDFRLLGGTGEFGVDVSRTTSGKDATGASAPNATGVSFTFIHTSQKWLGEENMNKFFIQYGRGPAKTFTSGFETYTINAGTFIRPDASDSYRFRVADNIIFETGQHFSISPLVLYQATDYKQYGGMLHWFSAGVRPQVHFNDYVSLAFEPFLDWVDDKSTNVSDYLFKMTFAPQVSLGRHFMSRPSIRGFVTYAQWGDGFKGKVGGPDYATSTQGLTWGVQMESWW
jgi:maltoporin